MNDASANVISPTWLIGIPTSRAPVRFTATARIALPISVRSKRSQSKNISTSDTATMMTL